MNITLSVMNHAGTKCTVSARDSENLAGALSVLIYSADSGKPLLAFAFYLKPTHIAGCERLQLLAEVAKRGYSDIAGLSVDIMRGALK